MTRFIQVHALTVYAPSNLNRDDTGRPKTAKFGGAERLRISSQALKRAIRTSAVFKSKLVGKTGERTAQAGDWFRAELMSRGLQEVRATAIAKTLSALIGTLDTSKPEPLVRNKELFFMAPEERASFKAMAEKITRDTALADELADAGGAADDDESDEGDEEAGKKKSKKKGLPKKRISELRETVLVTVDTAADIAMFGRMVAAAPEYNREAAVQVAHAITTHKVEVEDDFYTAVDDLKQSSEDAGAGFIGELGFGSGVFYVYACIDRDLLEKNLGGDTGLAATAIGAFIEGLATASPTGKQASFASRARASYLRIEKGSQQPRSLAAAFFRPVRGEDLLAKSIEEIDKLATDMTAAYGACFDGTPYVMHVGNGGSLDEAIRYATAE
ncbi:MAG: type I-E CRISPR-associated protein Cas7/Cse4/CasC [Hyphomicrobiaceae bacterium]